MMLITDKKLHTGARADDEQTKCLVIPLGDGIRVQYTVENEREAIALFNHYSMMHPHLKDLLLQA